MRETGKLDIGRCTVLPLGKHNAQDAGSLHRVFAKGLIEITDTKQQQRIRVFHLDAVVLLHERGFYNGGCIFFVDGTHGNFVDLKGIKSKTAATLL